MTNAILKHWVGLEQVWNIIFTVIQNNVFLNLIQGIV